MKAPIIFYSWQSDTKSRWNKNFIESCLQEAVKIASAKLRLENGIILHRDTTDVAGTPSIPATIFDRIDKCAVFVGDVSFVGRAFPKAQGAAQADANTQMFPNANVVLELGYAVKAIGWKRVISVMNTAYGTPEDQIFHFLQHRFPTTYSLKEEVQEESAKRELVCKLSEYISIALCEEYAEAIRTTQKLNSDCFSLVRFLKGTEYFSHQSFDQVVEPEIKQKLQSLFPGSVTRLLDLGVIYTHYDGATAMYSYKWTYLGDIVRTLV